VGAIVVGLSIEFFKAEFGDTQFHLVATGLLLALVVLFMPEGVIPAVKGLFGRFGPQASSIREVSAKDLLDGAGGAADDAPGPDGTDGTGAADGVVDPTADTTARPDVVDETRSAR
jgi:branched-chain amino acid transport system permease protein